MIKIISMIVLFTITANAQYLLLGPMVGHVDDDTANIWCSFDQKGTLKLKLSENADLKGAKTLTFNNFEMGSVKLEGLKPETVYYYQVLAHGHSKSPYLSFKTTPVKGKAVKLRFMFSSCSGHTGLNEDWTWDDLSRRKDMNLILMLGDNHYGDTTNPEVITKHYFSHRSIGGFRKTTSKIPTYGIWDDHDYGPNNSDGKTPGKEGSLAVFKKHWGNPGYGEKDNPGCYFTFHYGDVQFIMLDSRYHRTPNRSMKSDDPAKKMLGEKQFSWLEKTLKSSKAKVKFVANGSEFQMEGTSDGFAGFKAEQKRVLDLVKTVEGVVLLSGDRHFTAGYHVRGETVEVTSGPLGSKSFNCKYTRDMFFKRGPDRMFSIFDVDTTGKIPKLKLEVYATGKGKIKEMEFTWDQINGKEKVKREE